MWLPRKRLALHMSLLRSFYHCENRYYKQDAPNGAIGYGTVFHTVSSACLPAVYLLIPAAIKAELQQTLTATGCRDDSSKIRVSTYRPPGR